MDEVGVDQGTIGKVDDLGSYWIADIHGIPGHAGITNLRVKKRYSICQDLPREGEEVKISFSGLFGVSRLRIGGRWYVYYESAEDVSSGKMGTPPSDEVVKPPCVHPSMARYVARGGKQGCYTCSDEW